MPETIETYAARLAAAAGPDGRPVLDADGMVSWDVFPFEADGLRAKAFEPLADVPDDKVVVLGLVSSKFDELESPEQLLARIDEAAKFHPREQLALSTQCGFSSAGPGNAISEGAQEKKLRLIGEVAERAWG